MYLITPIWAACKAILGHFTRYAAPTAGATTRASGQRYICTDQPQTDTHRDTHEGRQSRRKGQKKRTEKGRNEGMKYYNKQQRAKLS